LSELAKPWFEREPALLEWELKRFAEWGIPVTLDEDHLARGQVVLRCETSLAGEPVPTEVRYPSEYPELPPQIFGPPGLLERHQHRFGGNFCLLVRPLDDWPAGSWGAADLLGERLTALFRDTEEGPEAVAAGEAPMPEPVSSYFATANDAAVIIPEGLRPIGESGSLAVRRCAPHLFLISSADGRQIDPDLGSLFPPAPEIAVPWLRLAAAPPAGPDGTQLCSWLAREHPGLLARELPQKLAGSSRLPAPPPLELCCLVFPEEGPGVGETRDGYLFVMVERSEAGRRRLLLAARPLERAELARRRPELEGLEERRALVIGAGTIGADVAVELAKAGIGELEVIDFDTLELGNMVRHRLSLDFAGFAKAKATAVAARRANPFCAASANELRLGATEWSGQSSLESLAEAIEAADIVIEASGAHQIAQLCGRLCAESETPMICAWLSEGFWGAEVMRYRPGESECWTCFARAQRGGERISAESGPESQVVVQGCSHPTTAGAGFDALEAAAIATRMAVSTLAPGGGYPDPGYDHVVLNFRRAPDDPENPRVAVERLEPNPECERCRQPAGSGARPTRAS
jgi:molybdopterin/thiamine biosynthesis adenylyltransferase